MNEHRDCVPLERLHIAWWLGLAVAGLLALGSGSSMSGMATDVEAAGSAVHNPAK